VKSAVVLPLLQTKTCCLQQTSCEHEGWKGLGTASSSLGEGRGFGAGGEALWMLFGLRLGGVGVVYWGGDGFSIAVKYREMIVSARDVRR
jgi:hypothetical protein